MRLILAGFVLVTAAVVLVAWFGHPPIADTIFDVSFAIVGVGVLGGFVGILVTGRWRGRE